jgi:hypothetical protein
MTTDYQFVASDVALYHRTLPAADTVLDAQTWDDLLLPAYSAQLARETSILGQQELHRRLQVDQDVTASAVRVRALLADTALRQRVSAASAGLRGTDREISVTLFGAALAPSPRWLPLLPWLPLALLLSAALALGQGQGWLWLWAVPLLLFLTLCAVQARHYEAVQEWARILNTTQQMLRAHGLLARIDDPATAALRDDGAAAERLNRRVSQSLLSYFPGVSDYADWMFLQNVRHYFHSRTAVRTHILFLRSSFARVAALEADLALARHLAQAPQHCWAQQGWHDGHDGHDGQVALDEVVHPLLADAAPLTFGMARQGVFISGQNGIGKSTLLRTIGLNLVTARAFGFCYAARAVTPRQPVYTSMQNDDAMESGESFYVAELRRGRELLALAAQRPAIFLIDEIFRGTNYLESVSAAAAVLHTLAQQGRVVVASHHLVLASLLSACLQPWCVSRVQGRWQLAPGLLQDTNGLALLTERGFDAEVAAEAGRIHARLLAHALQLRPAS